MNTFFICSTWLFNLINVAFCVYDHREMFHRHQ
nr:MAG TPA: hypothetical protein [Caudoviricetes sp.]DAZ58778.1 MAG TPA: hypothetical protein [Caudoviricetes sp.]